jgi:hypothetical protein
VGCVAGFGGGSAFGFRGTGGDPVFEEIERGVGELGLFGRHLRFFEVGGDPVEETGVGAAGFDGGAAAAAFDGGGVGREVEVGLEFVRVMAAVAVVAEDWEDIVLV